MSTKLVSFAAALLCTVGAQILDNPDRGSYVQTWHYFSPPGQESARAIEDLLAEDAKENVPLSETIERSIELGHTVIGRQWYFLGWQFEQSLDAAMLQKIRDDLNEIRKAKLRATILFAYSESLNDEVIDAPLEIVQKHLEQLIPIINDNKDVISTFLHGFMGSWGEMYMTTAYITEESKEQLLQTVVKAIPQDIPVAVRQLKYYDMIKQLMPNETDRIGLYDHCILADNTDTGTFTWAGSEEYQLTGPKIMKHGVDVDLPIQIDTQEPLNPEEIEKMMSNRFLKIGTSGESCFGAYEENGVAYWKYDPRIIECNYAMNHLKSLKMLQFNTDWFQNYTNAWKANGCWEKITKKLGYVPRMVGPSTETSVQIANDGWSLPPRKARSFAYIVPSSSLSSAQVSNVIRIELDWDIRKLPVGATTAFPLNIVGTGGVTLSQPHEVLIAVETPGSQNVPEYRIVFAPERWGARLNRIGLTLPAGTQLRATVLGTLNKLTGNFN